MRIRLYKNPQTGLPHIYDHEVTEDEVEQVLAQPGEDLPSRESSRIALGRTHGGRYLQVVYLRDPEPGSVFVITAYELRGKPLAAHKRRRKRRWD